MAHTNVEHEASAETVVLSYAPARESVRRELDARSYRRFLRTTRDGPVSAGEEWREFVSCGCGSPQDVVLRVEAVEGGDAVGPETDFEFVPAEAASDGEDDGSSDDSR
ncbi:MAG: hypothetical protein ABEJ28_11300 [Salinigranum sp.]